MLVKCRFFISHIPSYLLLARRGVDMMRVRARAITMLLMAIYLFSRELNKAGVMIVKNKLFVNHLGTEELEKRLKPSEQTFKSQITFCQIWQNDMKN